MPDTSSRNNDFIGRITEIIQENLSDEHFGVSELAREAGMSRSNLLRKIKKQTKLSASQFIRKVRLENAMEILKQDSLTVSEVSYRVGFGSTSYFVKCFRDFYGYPPGEVGKRDLADGYIINPDPLKKRRVPGILISVVVLIAIAVVLLIVNPFSREQLDLEKSIAVLPFINDSDDPTNVYFVNGIMESILNNLQKIENLRVISRTSVERYRNNTRLSSEIARELNVDYFVEGSGQRIGDQILLNVQLIDASTDKHLWAEQYTREAKDIFELQKEISKNITDNIEVIITPEEEERINKIPTDNLVAYDLFLQGLDLFYQGNSDSLQKAITYYEKAIEHDNEFARAYAGIAIAYYFLDVLQSVKKYTSEINNYADKALLFDPKLPQSLIAKALYYMNEGLNEQAVPYLEKALEYNPNSVLVINILADFYTNHIPDTEKYLEYALKGIQLDIAAQDSVTASFSFLHVSNAFLQSGFIKEAEIYIDKSLVYYPENLYSEYLKAYVIYARDRDLKQTKELLIVALSKDSTRLDIMQEVGKICYFMQDYESAYLYYGKFIEIKERYKLDIYRSENAKIAYVLSKNGQKEKSEEYLNDYKDYADNDQSIYKHLNQAMFYSYTGDVESALEHMRIFSQEDNYFYWIVALLTADPLLDNIKDLPEFKKIYGNLEKKFWNNHKQIKESLEKKNLI